MHIYKIYKAFCLDVALGHTDICIFIKLLGK